MLLSKNRESLIKSLCTRHGRKKSNLCICEGKRSVADLLMAKPELVKFTIIAESNKNSLPANIINPLIVSERKFSELSATVASQGILAVVERPELLSVEVQPVDPFILVLDRLTDPGNFGSILRTARAIGLTEVWYTAGSVDPFNDKVIRAAMASQFVVGLRSFASLDDVSSQLNHFGYHKIFRTDPHQGESCFVAKELFSRSAIIIGNEADGVALLAGANDIMIPMPGSAESLNAAQATTVILFEYIRRHPEKI